MNECQVKCWMIENKYVLAKKKNISRKKRSQEAKANQMGA